MISKSFVIWQIQCRRNGSQGGLAPHRGVQKILFWNNMQSNDKKTENNAKRNINIPSHLLD